MNDDRIRNELRQLVEEFRCQCLWFLREDFVLNTVPELLQDGRPREVETAHVIYDRFLTAQYH